MDAKKDMTEYINAKSPGHHVQTIFYFSNVLAICLYVVMILEIVSMWYFYRCCKVKYKIVPYQIMTLVFVENQRKRLRNSFSFLFYLEPHNSK